MKKIELIKEVNINGEVYYWVEYNGERVSPFTTFEEKAIKDFNEFTPIVPSKEIIKTREI